MSIRHTLPALFLVFVCFIPALAQQAPPAPLAAKPDYSAEPFILEQYRIVVRFENDGTGTREVTARVRVQSEAGVQRLGQLILGYSSANEKMEIGFVRVRRSDGTTVAAAPDAVQDLPAPVAREAPMYSDFREKHITVPGLRPGESLEYSVITRVETPLIPGQFWMEHEFEKNAIVLQEQLEISVPKEREIKLKTEPGHDPRVTTEGDRRIYRWTSSHLEREPEKDTAAVARKRPARKRPDTPDVQITTLRNWNDLGHWYAGLEKDRVAPTPEVRAKAAELTRNANTDLEKIQLLYDYVARNFRYISLSFGVGRYQPHAAGDILGHEYGDCKDKHTLLASLLDSVGIPVEAALINSMRDVDPDVPSPSQFNHMITAIPQGKSYLWLDTTTEVAPFRLLAPVLRAKQALVVSADGGARLVQTPYESPLPNMQDVEIEAKVSELGKLEGHVRLKLRGDSELGFRMYFRHTAPTQWKNIVQALNMAYGLGGEVANVSTSDPAVTQEPFRVEYDVAQSDYLDWSRRKSQPVFFLPIVVLKDAEGDSNDKLQLEPPGEFHARLKLHLPPTIVARAAVPVTVTRDYGEYHSTYKVEGSTVTAERVLSNKMGELPAARLGDYQAFARALRADGEQKLAIESTAAGTPTIPNSAGAGELYDAGQAALKALNFQAAAGLFERVVKLDPKHATAWLYLGRADLTLNRLDDAVNAFHKQLDLSPYDETAYSNLGFAYWRQQKYADAAFAFRKQLEINPLDDYAFGSLGVMYCEMKKYSDAVPQLEKAISLKPDNASYQVSLGQAYLNLEQPEKAIAAFDSAVEAAPLPVIWNNVAYELSKRKVRLDRAQQYAESAIAATEAVLRNVSLDRLRPEDLAQVTGLAAYWDTLGWIHFQNGNLEAAEKFIRSAWMLVQHAEIGDHLGQLYEKRGDKQQAARFYTLALSAFRPDPDIRARLAALVGEKNVSSMLAKSGDTLSAERTVTLGPLVKDKTSAEFFVLFVPGPRVEAAKFVSGDEKLKTFASALVAAHYPVEFPDANPTKLVRRGILSCDDGQCRFVFLSPEDVHSVN